MARKEKKGVGAETSARFARIRRDHARETAEDYAEMLLDLEEEGRTARPSDLAKALGVSHVTVLRALDRLVRDGLVLRHPEQGIHLSPEGTLLGQEARTRHRLLVSFLEKLGVPPDTAALDAEGIEHHLSEITLARMATFLEEEPA